MREILEGRGRADAFVPAPGVREFLLALKADGIRIGVVTSGLHEKAWPELVAAFTLERVMASPAQVDLTKLAWMNGEHLRRRPLAERVAGCRADLAAHGLWRDGQDEAYLERVVEVMAERVRLFTWEKAARRTLAVYREALGP